MSCAEKINLTAMAMLVQWLDFMRQLQLTLQKGFTQFLILPTHESVVCFANDFCKCKVYHAGFTQSTIPDFGKRTNVVAEKPKSNVETFTRETTELHTPNATVGGLLQAETHPFFAKGTVQVDSSNVTVSVQSISYHIHSYSMNRPLGSCGRLDPTYRNNTLQDLGPFCT